MPFFETNYYQVDFDMKYGSLKSIMCTFWFGLSILGHRLLKMPGYMEGSDGFSSNVHKHLNKTQ